MLIGKMIKFISVIIITLQTWQGTAVCSEEVYLRTLAFDEREYGVSGVEQSYKDYQRLGEDLYYLTRYTMEKIVDIPFDDFNIEEFRDSAVKCASLLYKRPRPPVRGVVNGFIRRRATWLVARKRGWVRPSYLKLIVGKLDRIISKPGPDLVDSLVLSKDQIMQSLILEVPELTKFIETGRNFTTTIAYVDRDVLQIEVARAKQLRDEIDNFLAVTYITTRERQVFELAYDWEGTDRYHSVAEIAKILDISSQRVRQILDRLGSKLHHCFSRIEAHGEPVLDISFLKRALDDERLSPADRALAEAIMKAHERVLSGLGTGYRKRSMLELFEEYLVLRDKTIFLKGQNYAASRPGAHSNFLTYEDEDRLLAWFEERVSPIQKVICPYVLRNMSDEETARALKMQGVSIIRRPIKLTISRERKNLIPQLRRWFTLGCFGEYGTVEQIKEELIRLLSETPLERMTRRSTIDFAAELAARQI